MARLIDADKLRFSKAFCVDEAGFGTNIYVVDKRDIDEMPTAYDVDKVVEQLALKHLESEECPKFERVFRQMAFEEAIEIVRKGGVSNE